MDSDQTTLPLEVSVLPMGRRGLLVLFLPLSMPLSVSIIPEFKQRSSGPIGDFPTVVR